MKNTSIFDYFRLMRFDKPIGILLLLWPTLWALWIANHGMPPWHLLWIFITGVVVMRAAGCIVNDIADREFDRFVKRTANRPMTVGKVSVKKALIVFFILILIAAFLVLQLNFLSFMLSLLALLLACLYPFTKRWTYWPQLFLGAAFAMAVLMAFAATLNHLPPISGLVYLIALIWPLMYDTQYALVDREDDMRIGIKSTAIRFGRYDVLIISLLQIVLLILWFTLGIWLNFKLSYFVALIVASSLFIYQFLLIRTGIPGRCFGAFLNNQWIGLVIFLGIVLGQSSVH